MDKLLVIDTETSGLDPLRHSLLSVGAVVWCNGEIADTFDIFISEPNPLFDKESLEINKINLDWLAKNGLPPPIAVRKFHDFLKKHFDVLEESSRISLAGHNIAFDVGFLRRLYRISDADFDRIFSHRLLDTAGIIQFLMLAGKLKLTSGSSTEAFEYFKVPLEPKMRHTALGDALATAILLTRLLDYVRYGVS